MKFYTKIVLMMGIFICAVPHIGAISPQESQSIARSERTLNKYIKSKGELNTKDNEAIQAALEILNIYKPREAKQFDRLLVDRKMIAPEESNFNEEPIESTTELESEEKILSNITSATTAAQAAGAMKKAESWLSLSKVRGVTTDIIAGAGAKISQAFRVVANKIFAGPVAKLKKIQKDQENVTENLLINITHAYMNKEIGLDVVLQQSSSISENIGKSIKKIRTAVASLFIKANQEDAFALSNIVESAVPQKERGVFQNLIYEIVFLTCVLAEVGNKILTEIIDKEKKDNRWISISGKKQEVYNVENHIISQIKILADVVYNINLQQLKNKEVTPYFPMAFKAIKEAKPGLNYFTAEGLHTNANYFEKNKNVFDPAIRTQWAKWGKRFLMFAGLAAGSAFAYQGGKYVLSLFPNQVVAVNEGLYSIFGGGVMEKGFCKVKEGFHKICTTPIKSAYKGLTGKVTSQVPAETDIPDKEGKKVNNFNSWISWAWEGVKSTVGFGGSKSPIEVPKSTTDTSKPTDTIITSEPTKRMEGPVEVPPVKKEAEVVNFTPPPPKAEEQKVVTVPKEEHLVSKNSEFIFVPHSAAVDLPTENSENIPMNNNEEVQFIDLNPYLSDEQKQDFNL